MASSLKDSRCDQPASPEPAWEIATLFPPQGEWSEAAYLSFTESLGQFVELVDGSIEVPAMPTKTHQQIVHAMLAMLLGFLRASHAGDAVAAPYRMRLRDGTFREPDVAVYTTEHLDRFGERYGEPADIVIEVVSDDMVAILRGKTPAERLAMTHTLWRTDRKRLFYSIKSLNPNWDEDRVLMETARRMQGSERAE